MHLCYVIVLFSSSAATSSVTSPYHKSSGSVMRDRRSIFDVSTLRQLVVDSCII